MNLRPEGLEYLANLPDGIELGVLHEWNQDLSPCCALAHMWKFLGAPDGGWPWGSVERKYRDQYLTEKESDWVRAVSFSEDHYPERLAAVKVCAKELLIQRGLNESLRR